MQLKFMDKSFISNFANSLDMSKNTPLTSMSEIRFFSISCILLKSGEVQESTGGKPN